MLRIGVPFLPCAGCGFPLCPACQPSPSTSTPGSGACQPPPPSPPTSPPASRGSSPVNQVSPASPALPAGSPPTQRASPKWHKDECDLLMVRIDEKTLPTQAFIVAGKRMATDWKQPKCCQAVSSFTVWYRHHSKIDDRHIMIDDHHIMIKCIFTFSR